MVKLRNPKGAAIAVNTSEAGSTEGAVNAVKLRSPEAVAGYAYDVFTKDGGDCTVLFYVPYAPFLPAEGVAYTDAFYLASAKAHTAAKAYAAELCASGINAMPNPRADYKSMAKARSAAGGLNSLAYLKGCGSRFAIGAVEITGAYMEKPAEERPVMPCGECRRCADACPVNAIGGDRDECARNAVGANAVKEGVGAAGLAERCLRRYQFKPELMNPASLPLFKTLLGCDICQRVCPVNAAAQAVEMPEELRSYLRYENFYRELQGGDLQTFAGFFGANYAIRNSLLAMLLVNIANAGRGDLRYMAEQSRLSESPRVRYAAEYAIRKISGQT